MRSRGPRGPRRESAIVWLDLGDLGALVRPRGVHEQWQDHGLGLLRTILHRDGLHSDVRSTRAVTDWRDLAADLAGYGTLLMNVRSYTFPLAVRAARLFKEVNPGGLVLTGGMHAAVATDEMKGVEQFDKICAGPGEGTIVDLVRDPSAFPRVFPGRGAKSMDDWPVIDRELWPRPVGWRARRRIPWPLEPACGWGPAPVASVLTSRVCPWQCAFCNEASYIPSMGRRSVESVIDELNGLDEKYGIGSVVIHDSMFFQNPSWLREWLETYPRRARRTWPYWAAARSDTVRRWPDLFEALVRDTNWSVISIGFESGSDRVLRLLNKECTEDDNNFAIDLLNRIGDDLEAEGRDAPRFWANFMLGIPGERREDAEATLRMLQRMKRALPSMSYYAPYPGSALGHQLIAEGKSMMSADNYHRFPGDEKVRGVDYDFYRELRASGVAAATQIAPVEKEAPRAQRSHSLFLFAMRNGKMKLAWGADPEDALRILSTRLSSAEMAEIAPASVEKIRQRRLRERVHELG